MQTDLLTQIRAAGLPEPMTEFVFYAKRNWRLDFYWPELALAAEVEGGTWGRKMPDGSRQPGRHNRPQGYEDDCEKYNTATLFGIRLFRFTTNMVRDGSALALLERVLRGDAK